MLPPGLTGRGLRTQGGERHLAHRQAVLDKRMERIPLPDVMRECELHQGRGTLCLSH